ncbi:MAG: tripartite tricarboxylate transporter substrate binding protein [Candidatus Parcubacteria bacterium]|nr:tripartite tricarboxylate transporter substrate binding protein [Burkholderiales bacterium]
MKRWLIAAVLAMLVPAAHAQDVYPSKVVRIIVPYPAGGIADKIAREVAQDLGKRVGQSVIVENRAGAAGNVGMDYVAKQPADGYTLVLAPASNLTVNDVLFKNLSYDIRKDFAPVSLLILTPQVLVAHPSVGVKNMKDAVAYIKANPEKANYGSPGIGSFSHLAGEMLGFEAGVKLLHVPYQGQAPAVNDLLAGTLRFMFVEVITGAPHIKAGKFTPIAIANTTRAPWLPEVPTMGEAGYPNIQVASWYGLMARSGTPGPVMARLTREARDIMRSDEMKKRYDDIGAYTVGSSPEEFDVYIRSETAKWVGLIKKVGIQPQ